MNNLIKKIILLSALCSITFFAVIGLAKAEESNYTNLILSFENINIAAGETKITDLNVTNNSNYLLANGQLVLELKCDGKPFDGVGIDIWFSSVGNPYKWRSPDSAWQDGKLTFSGFKIASGDSIFYLKIKANPALYPRDYIFSLIIEGQADTGLYVKDIDREVTVSATKYDVIIDSNVANLATIIVPSNVTNATINMTDLLTTTDTERIVNTPASNDLEIQADTSVGEVKMKIPADTKITAASDSNWTGVINIPTVKPNSSVTVIPDSGKTASVESVIEIGFDDTVLIFNKAVRIVFTGKAGKYVGYSRGGVFISITTTCNANDQATVDAQLDAEGDCKIDIGSDLAIWTKHFTKFVTYTQAAIVSGITGGGGGGGGTTIPTYKTGDINKDGKVDKYDFSMMMAAWGKTGSNTSDLNGDNKVDKYDFALLMSKWSTM